MIYLLIALAILVVFLLYNASRFEPYHIDYEDAEAEDVDYKSAHSHLSELIKCKTVSYEDYGTAENREEFLKFQRLLKEFYPEIYQNSEYKVIGETGLYHKIKGESAAEATVLMAHYDVVPAGDQKKWVKPPFSGLIEDGILYGRGTLDTKGTLLGVMEAVDYMLKKGYKPKHDLYLCFGGDEETQGTQQLGIRDYLIKNGVNITLVVDEGGAIVENAFPTVNKRIAAVGTGEKGSVNFEIEVRGDGGHSSNPPKHTAVGKLAKDIVKIENMKFKSEISQPFSQMLDIAGRHASFGFKIILANRWLFNPLLKLIFLNSGGEMAAMCHTTSAVTMARGSDLPNVLPPTATATINFRSLNIDSNESIRKKIMECINDNDAEVRCTGGSEASSYSDITTKGYEAVRKAINQTWGNDVVVSPYLMIACSDSRHYSEVCDTVLRFCPMQLDRKHRDMIHNYNEQIELSMIDNCIDFYINLIRQL